MKHKHTVSPEELAYLAKQARTLAGKSQSDVARELKTSRTSVFNAEESPERSLAQVRIKIIETYTNFKVVGPVYRIVRKNTNPSRTADVKKSAH